MGKLEINYENILPDLPGDKNIILWRYMSFSSLCEILMNDYIPLISVSKFSDKSEGIILRSILSKRPNTHQDSINFAMQKYFETIYISSWHKSRYEDAAMWDRYTQGREGVAIKTNAELLKECIALGRNMIWYNDLLSDVNLNNLGPVVESDATRINPELMIKRVEYVSNNPIDFEMEEKYLQNGYDKLCFFYKLEDFRNESEVRILKSTFGNPYGFATLNPSNLYRIDDALQTHVPSEDSVKLKLDSANKLVEKIVVSPYAHDRFIETVKQTISCINKSRESLGLDLIKCEVVESRRKDWV